ncbi:MAG: biotin/lipoyl-binding protein, partial [Treponemataceae bacterium]|nr:biotin/lipoyl-binding protein [Treponemataceae bacterium]
MKKNGLSKGTKRALAALIAVVAVALIVFGARMAVVSSRKTDEVTYRVRREIYENVIEIAGTASAAKEQTLQAKTDGTVIAVYAKEGDVVKKGDVLLQVDDTTQVYN